MPPRTSRSLSRVLLYPNLEVTQLSLKPPFPRSRSEKRSSVRESTRRFAQKPISFTALSTILHGSTKGLPVDYSTEGDHLTEVHLIVNSMDSVPEGAYYFHKPSDTLVPSEGGKVSS